MPGLRCVRPIRQLVPRPRHRVGELMALDSIIDCAVCGEPVAQDLEYGGYVHLGRDMVPDRTHHGHYAEPIFTPGEGW